MFENSARVEEYLTLETTNPKCRQIRGHVTDIGIHNYCRICRPV